MMTTSVYSALLKAQAAAKDALHDANNKHLKNRYASFKSILEAVRPALRSNGLVLLYDTRVSHDHAILTVTARVVIEIEGASYSVDGVESCVHYPFNIGWTPQQVNAACTYGKKVTTLALLAITSTEEDEADDDGEAVSASVDTPVRPEQILRIKDLLTQANGSDDSTVLAKSFGCESLQDFTEGQADRAIKAIQAKIARSKK